MHTWARKGIALAISGVLTVGMAASLPFSSFAESAGENVIFQAECEDLDGATTWTDIYGQQFPGYSGSGFCYLTGETLTFEVEAPEEGMYEFTTRSAQILDKDGREQTISINGSEFMMKMPYADSWTDFSFGIHRLKKGTNKIQILPRYGYGAYDTITVKKADLPALNVSPTLSDSKATSETQGLMNYLCDVYGKHMLSGQQEIYGGGHTESSPNGYSGADLQGYETEFEYIKKKFGDYPAIRGFDYMNYNPLYGWVHKNRKPDGTPYNIYRDGLKIYTTINSVMQTYAEQAVQRQMEKEIQPKMDAQFRATKTLFVDADKEERDRIMRHAVRYSDRYREMKHAGAGEKEINAAFDKPCNMRVFTYKGERDTLMTPRDSILHHKRIMRAAMVSLDPATGFVKAYVGGPNFRYFKYDMAKQGKRQIGSTIKPFVYTFAIDHLGLTPCTMVPNLPTTIETANGTAWSPKEAGNVEYDGVLHPLKWGLARSRNNYSAWIMKQAKQPAAVADFIHNMGIRSYIDPVPALALGSSESNVYELVSAFSTFANQGVHTDPIFVTRIEDRQGNLIASFIPQSQDAVSERTAYTMLTMLQDVVNSGTAGRLRWQFGLTDMEIGGKTGTSNKNRDAWFMCVTPKLVTGAWVGGEDQSVHFIRGGEGSVMALPIVGEYMKKIYDDGRFGISRTDQFVRPAMMPRYDCEDEVDSEGRNNPEDDNFFD